MYLIITDLSMGSASLKVFACAFAPVEHLHTSGWFAVSKLDPSLFDTTGPFSYIIDITSGSIKMFPEDATRLSEVVIAFVSLLTNFVSGSNPPGGSASEGNIPVTPVDTL